MDEFDLLFPLPDNVENLALPDPHLHQFYSDLGQRTVYLLDDISDNNCFLIIRKIIDWNRLDSKIVPEDRDPIKLIIASNGGDLDSARSLIDIIEISETPIYGIALGTVASAASLIYLACHYRSAIKSAKFIWHKGAIMNLSGAYQDVQNFNTNYQKVIKEMMDFYNSHTSFSKEEIEKNMVSDWYIDVDTALNNGVIHHIIEDIGVFL